ncbi:putative Glucosidase 2 subunit beta [Blattamonas nauphoetae]|uniref:Glucosidase 2 subunit beta n=1 Tax=Blattamonas nauphoetae TaxID=2049346 RepID=A0ABQ9YMF4_9EUKA|nr:putative Glucosidase 2 subunit beta [Blattamonas nauphoetae]
MFWFAFIVHYALCGRYQFSWHLHGVHPEEHYLYTNNTFTCKDGSKTIPISKVNDDICDCPDGSDEPGTSACPRGKFWCINRGGKGIFIDSSKVGDGICDCCDGSDEMDENGTTKCINTCRITSSNPFIYMPRQYDNLEEGKINREIEVNAAKLIEEDYKRELAELRENLKDIAEQLDLMEELESDWLDVSDVVRGLVKKDRRRRLHEVKMKVAREHMRPQFNVTDWGLGFMFYDYGKDNVSELNNPGSSKLSTARRIPVMFLNTTLSQTPLISLPSGKTHISADCRFDFNGEEESARIFEFLESRRIGRTLKAAYSTRASEWERWWGEDDPDDREKLTIIQMDDVWEDKRKETALSFLKRERFRTRLLKRINKEAVNWIPDEKEETFGRDWLLKKDEDRQWREWKVRTMLEGKNLGGVELVDEPQEPTTTTIDARAVFVFNTTDDANGTTTDESGTSSESHSGTETNGTRTSYFEQEAPTSTNPITTPPPSTSSSDEDDGSVKGQAGRTGQKKTGSGSQNLVDMSVMDAVKKELEKDGPQTDEQGRINGAFFGNTNRTYQPNFSEKISHPIFKEYLQTDEMIRKKMLQMMTVKNEEERIKLEEEVQTLRMKQSELSPQVESEHNKLVEINQKDKELQKLREEQAWHPITKELYDAAVARRQKRKEEDFKNGQITEEEMNEPIDLKLSQLEPWEKYEPRADLAEETPRNIQTRMEIALAHEREKNKTEAEFMNPPAQMDKLDRPEDHPSYDMTYLHKNLTGKYKPREKPTTPVEEILYLVGRHPLFLPEGKKKKSSIINHNLLLPPSETEKETKKGTSTSLVPRLSSQEMVVQAEINSLVEAYERDERRTGRKNVPLWVSPFQWKIVYSAEEKDKMYRRIAEIEAFLSQDYGPDRCFLPVKDEDFEIRQKGQDFVFSSLSKFTKRGTKREWWNYEHRKRGKQKKSTKESWKDEVLGDYPMWMDDYMGLLMRRAKTEEQKEREQREKDQQGRHDPHFAEKMREEAERKREREEEKRRKEEERRREAEASGEFTEDNPEEEEKEEPDDPWSKTVHVHFVCGLESRLFRVAERSKTEWEAIFETPCMCTDEHMNKMELKKRLRELEEEKEEQATTQVEYELMVKREEKKKEERARAELRELERQQKEDERVASVRKKRKEDKIARQKEKALIQASLDEARRRKLDPEERKKEEERIKQQKLEEEKRLAEEKKEEERLKKVRSKDMIEKEIRKTMPDYGMKGLHASEFGWDPEGEMKRKQKEEKRLKKLEDKRRMAKGEETEEEKEERERRMKELEDEKAMNVELGIRDEL